MIKKILLLMTVLLSTVPGPTRADQHAWLSPQTAERVSQLIMPGMSLRFFCQPCGDKTWTEQEVKHIVLRSGSDHSEVVINGKGIDLAYTYILSDGQWTNLAMLLDLETSGVSQTLNDASANKTQTPGSELEKPGAEHPVDQWLTECMDKDPTTAGMNNCLFEAYEKWDAELNRAYMALRKRLSPSQQKALKAAQVEWLKYRDAEFELIEQFYSGFEGTMYQPMRLEDRVEIVRKRVLGLRSYQALLEDK